SDVRRPEIEFAYNFTDDLTHNRGALTQITYPSGGKTIFGYELIRVGADEAASPGARNLTIPNPFGAGGATPRIWYGPDYVVCGWLDTNGSLVINVFTWVGRWYQAWRGWLALGQGVAIDVLTVATSGNAFIGAAPRHTTVDLYLFNRQHLSAGDWHFEDNGKALPKAHTYSGPVQVSAGNDFFVVVCQDPMAPAVDRYAWNWST